MNQEPDLRCPVGHGGVVSDETHLLVDPPIKRRSFYCEDCGSKIEPSLKYAIVGMLEFAPEKLYLVTPEISQNAIRHYYEVHHHEPKAGELQQDFMMRVLTTLRDDDGITRIE